MSCVTGTNEDMSINSKYDKYAKYAETTEDMSLNSKYDKYAKYGEYRTIPDCSRGMSAP
jgi:hypothetical protein